MPVRVTKLPTTFFMFTKVPSTYLDQWLALSTNFPREYTCSLTMWKTGGQALVRQQIMSRKWAWIGHALKRSNDCIAEQALAWNPQGSRWRGRPLEERHRPYHPVERSLLAPARTPVHGQTGLEGLCMFRNGIIKASDQQIRSEFFFCIEQRKINIFSSNVTHRF